MHWRGHWWGTEIVADTKEDETLLKSLAEKLGKEPLKTYDGGELEVSDGPDTEFNPPGGFTITFNR